MLRYFEKVTQKFDKHCAEIESKNMQIEILNNREMELERDLESKNKQIRQQDENMKMLQIENAIYKSKKDSMTTVLDKR